MDSLNIASHAGFDLFQHPVFHPLRLRINTPAINELKNNIKNTLWTAGTGAAILGFTRAGKTTALQEFVSGIELRDNTLVPVVLYTVPKRDQQTIRSLLYNLCGSLDLPLHSRDEVDSLKDRLITHWAEQCDKDRVDRIVLLVDEAQRLAIGQLDLFSEFLDLLAQRHKVSLVVFFVGNKEQVSRLLDRVYESGHEHIEGRFFRQYYTFSGLRNKDEVAFCLKEYDTLRFPENGPTYTEYFLPQAFANGFRLSSLASSIWNEFRKYKGPLVEDWAMDFFLRAVNLLLTDYLGQDGVDSYKPELFGSCIEVSGLVVSRVKI